jgi:hypothetical protein
MGWAEGTCSEEPSWSLDDAIDTVDNGVLKHGKN